MSIGDESFSLRKDFLKPNNVKQLTRNKDLQLPPLPCPKNN